MAGWERIKRILLMTTRRALTYDREVGLCLSSFSGSRVISIKAAGPEKERMRTFNGEIVVAR